jgi:hypothetical protein
MLVTVVNKKRRPYSLEDIRMLLSNLAVNEKGYLYVTFYNASYAIASANRVEN